MYRNNYSMYSLNQLFNAINYALCVTNYNNLFFKAKQHQILESVILKRDTVGILLTGYGKSVLFHLLPFVAGSFQKMRDRIQIIVTLS